MKPISISDPRNDNRQNGQRRDSGEQHTTEHDSGESALCSRAFPKRQAKEAHDCTQPNQRNSAKCHLSSSVACISNVAAQRAGLCDFRGNQPSLHASQRRNKTETCYRALSSVHAPNQKGEHASTKSQKHNAHDEGHSLPHDEPARKKS